MTMTFKRRLPIPMEIREEMPLSADMAARKPAFDAEVAAIIRGESPRRLLVIGPCSADREDSVLDYVTRLAKLADEVKDKLLVVPRVYTNKPRTRGTGYKGLLHNPDPEAPADLLEGVKAIRRMHLRVVEETGMFTADEMLYPANFQYLIDLLAYVAVGARSVENQEHRLVASGVPMPVGMKNPTGGSTAVLLNSIYAAQAPQTFIFRNWEVETTGNPLAHAVLRGYVGPDGATYPNYHYEYLERLADRYDPEKFEFPAVVIDCNHDNSGKRPLEQARIVDEVLDSVRRSERIAGLFRGFMVESYLVDGNQPVGGGVYGQSITDACIGWEGTERLVRDMAERL
ncbi:3-deoxy-7-phosphoheptulonate synthase [Olsenella sp. AF16-14LB]|jgi:3-deoxy-7-phosphoheptulonate synthase|uniref:3-deoxy-7-phosphoheptulonate synthase n=1 Tax=unclassified Olsenella TaxID=2638792 RepID=UPI0005099195|nr:MULTISPECIES: 3-deoxy-7-phosphoheptulonate synthase [unclassified Olsenella]RGJ45139.1 3-deoxy-7-phosphoheptulonate synthase [Olsenella sp. TM06-36]RGS50297.1 3-deoxy-7-phosphoheptulonate synthase [Olsenella sp. AF21-51]RGU48701.1 3-deoxy-7-phosphoheptulonate synthase [Olsenella sp. AF16-14LB]RGU80993.1 3-deoxy-7-phosphoheptulonate synthase [Olsenella sp. AF15-43LB]RHB54356.1 3-deoxy-7-phosphoheptulonate synthase [Olsenella sp. AM39-30AC]